MLNEVIISKLDELIGEFNTPFFNYLLYSYNLDLNDCEMIITDLRDDINEGKITNPNVISVVDEYFKLKIIELEKKDKLEFLGQLIQEDNEFFIKYLRKYNLSDDDINVIYDKVSSKISDENITDFEIKRFLEYYFSNVIKQESYLNDLDFIVGRNYDTLIIDKAYKSYPILNQSDIYRIVSEIHSKILDAVEFKKGIKNEFLRQAMIKSEAKKARARENLSVFVEDSGDSFKKFVESKRLTKRQGEIVISEIMDDINAGLVQPDDVDSVFITNRFNEYYERQ